MAGRGTAGRGLKVFEQDAYLVVRAESREAADRIIQNVVPLLLRAHADADTGVDLCVGDAPLTDVTAEYGEEA